MKQNELVFLDYLSRSGSTLLAKRLAEFEGLKVSIEPKFLIDYNPSNLKVNNDDDLKEYIDYLYTQKKFLGWKIERGELYNRLSALNFPLRFDEALTEMIDLSYPDLGKNTLLIKGGGHYCINIQSYLNFFTDMKVLFIIRDPRAIFNSQKRSINSATGKPMQENLLRFVKNFKAATRNIHDSRYSKHIKVIYYEALLENQEEVLMEVIKFINPRSSFERTNVDYFDSIPDEQKHLHLNVNSKKNLVDRKQAWQNELTNSEIKTLEYLLRKELKIWKYEFIFKEGISLTAAFSIVKNFINRFINNARSRITARK